MIDEIPVTTGFKRALYTKKYSIKNGNHLGITMDAFKSVDWEGHARAVDTSGGLSLQRLI